MAEWIYFLHPPRENFAATMTDEETARAERRPYQLGFLRGRDCTGQVRR